MDFHVYQQEKVVIAIQVYLGGHPIVFVILSLEDRVVPKKALFLTNNKLSKYSSHHIVS